MAREIRRIRRMRWTKFDIFYAINHLILGLLLIGFLIMQRGDFVTVIFVIAWWLVLTSLFIEWSTHRIGGY
jgi:hypothetical protein